MLTSVTMKIDRKTGEILLVPVACPTYHPLGPLLALDLLFHAPLEGLHSAQESLHLAGGAVRLAHAQAAASLSRAVRLDVDTEEEAAERDEEVVHGELFVLGLTHVKTTRSRCKPPSK